MDALQTLNTLIDYHRGNGLTLTELARILGVNKDRFYAVYRACHRYTNSREQHADATQGTADPVR